ncbi:glycoside hydrolase family 25 protein (plasmid) [Priestia filamentosa]|nr:glycoside hydrolase family 25 protein [Priestia filamentosa]
MWIVTPGKEKERRGYFMERKGIDISHYQGDIDWSKVSNDGISFAFIKATEGSEDGSAIVDKYLDKNVNGTNDNGIDAGAYHFAKFVSVNDAVAEAKWFVKNIKGLPLTLPPVLDLEENNTKSDAEMNKAARAFMEHVEKEIGSCILYSFGNFYRDHVDKSLLKDFTYWHARYASTPINERLEDLFAWQYSKKGSVAGISGPVDLNKSGGKFFLNSKGSTI